MGLFDFIKKLGTTNSTPTKSASPCPEAQKVINDARLIKTDLLIMSAHGAACPKCAKYQGRVYSISGKCKMFPPVPIEFFEYCGIHEGCGHSFFPYIHGVNDPDLKSTLRVHPLQNKLYGKDIVTFSNRPFMDDRTDAAKQDYERHLEALQMKDKESEYWKEFWEQEAIRKANDEEDFRWLQTHFPDYCPKSSTGYRRMKTQNTKNFQKLKQLAAELGKEI